MATHDPPVTTDYHERPTDLLCELLQFETVNPPGDERACIEWIGEVLSAYGVEYETYARDPERPNLLAQVPGGDAPPLLLYGHVDVVPVEESQWSHDPFAGVVADGYVWGRGALDMKSGVAMFLAAFLRTVVTDEQPAGDLLFLAVSDEESGGDDGLGFLVEEHPELFEDVEYALGEFGGFSFDAGGLETYPIQVNEKQVCWMEATFTGPSGHASLPTADTAVGEMAAFVRAVDGQRLPVHVTGPVEAMIEDLAAEVPAELAGTLQGLLDPDRTDEILDAMGEQGRVFDALLHNTANVTRVRGGDKENVVPGEATAFLDCRLVPGQEPADVIAELEALTDTDPEFEVVKYDPGPSGTDMGLYDDLAGHLEAAVEDGVTIPFVMFGGTDGRHLAKIGVQSYGYTPMQVGDIPFLDLAHSSDERIPAETVEWGTDRVVDAIRGYEA